MGTAFKIFVSYTQADRQWAEWIAWQLEAAQHEVRIQAWDFEIGTNFVNNMNQASRWADATMPVLSPAYLKSGHCTAEWTAAFAKDPTGEKGTLIPVRVRDFDVPGLLGPIVYINLVDLGPEEARQALLNGLRRGRRKPMAEPPFPGVAFTSLSLPNTQSAPSQEPEFPQFDSVGMPHNNRFFTGRDAFLEKLHQHLENSDASYLAQAAINGIGGIGKSQIAIEYAYRYDASYGQIFWASAERRETLDESYTRFARHLDLVRPEESLDHSIDEVKRWLAKNESWLMVFDNADDPNLVRDYLPPRRRGGRVLLTSRATAFFDLGVDVPFTVEKMSPEEAVLFLLRMTSTASESGKHDTQDRVAAGELSEALDHFPLALAQAASYLKRRKKTFASYLQSYRNRGPELLDTYPAGADYPKSVTTTWDLNFKSVDEECGAATELFKAAAFLVPDSIPYEIFTLGGTAFGGLLAAALCGADQETTLLEELLIPLENYSLVETLRGGAFREGAFKVNRLTQQVIRHDLTDQERQDWTRRVALALTQAYPEAKYETWQQRENLQPHVLAMESWLTQFELHVIETGELFNQASRFARERAELRTAERLARRGLEIHQRDLQEDDRLTLKSRICLGEVLLLRGNYKEAHEILDRAFQLGSQKFGEEDLITLEAKGGLGQVFVGLEAFEKARDFHEEVLAVRKQSDVLGAHHRDTLASMNNLAIAWRKLGELDRAQDLYEDLLRIYAEQGKEQHPASLTALNNLAIVFWQRGDPRAQARFEKALLLNREVLGQHHPKTVISAWGLLKIALKKEDDDGTIDRLLDELSWLIESEEEDISSDKMKLARRFALEVRDTRQKPIQDHADSN